MDLQGPLAQGKDEIDRLLIGSVLEASEFHKKHHVNSKGLKKNFSITWQQAKNHGNFFVTNGALWLAFAVAHDHAGRGALDSMSLQCFSDSSEAGKCSKSMSEFVWLLDYDTAPIWLNYDIEDPKDEFSSPASLRCLMKSIFLKNGASQLLYKPMRIIHVHSVQIYSTADKLSEGSFLEKADFPLLSSPQLPISFHLGGTENHEWQENEE
ncbi:Integrase, zinc-binding domain containing protein [Cricetulus griseus]|nr:Integrase, zinc-binding domain containing protein [Cricetulus griseus]